MAKRLIKYLFLCLYIFKTLEIKSQNKTYYITGIVIDSLKNQGIPNALIYLKNKKWQTTSLKNGKFKLQNQAKKNPFLNDSLFIRCLGYSTKKIVLKNSNNLPIKIYLNTKKYNLNQTKVNPKKPVEYIQQSNKFFTTHLPKAPSKEITYNHTILFENQKKLFDQYFLFKAIYSYNPTNKINLQLLDYKIDNINNGVVFMNKKKHQKKVTKHLQKYNFLDTQNYTSHEASEKLLNKLHKYILFGRWYNASFLKYSAHFMHPEDFKKFNYKITYSCDSADSILIIHCQTKKNIKNSKIKATMYFDCKDFSLIKVYYKVRLIPSILLKTFFIATGYHLISGNFNKSVTLKKINDYWFFDHEEITTEIEVKKKSFFITQYHSKFKVLSKSKNIKTEINTNDNIPSSLLFNKTNLNFKSQIRPSENIDLSKVSIKIP